MCANHDGAIGLLLADLELELLAGSKTWPGRIGRAWETGPAADKTRSHRSGGGQGVRRRGMLRGSGFPSGTR